MACNCIKTSVTPSKLLMIGRRWYENSVCQIYAIPERKSRRRTSQCSTHLVLSRIVVARRPWYDNAYNLLGYAHCKLVSYEQFLKFYLKAIDPNSHNRGALEYLGEIYLTLGCMEHAQTMLTRLETAQGLAVFRGTLQVFFEDLFRLGRLPGGEQRGAEGLAHWFGIWAIRPSITCRAMRITSGAGTAQSRR